MTTTMYSREHTRLGKGSRYINLQELDNNETLLIGLACFWAFENLWTYEKMNAMREEFKSKKDYEDMIETFVKYWGDTATLFRNEDEWRVAFMMQGFYADFEYDAK